MPGGRLRVCLNCYSVFCSSFTNTIYSVSVWNNKPPTCSQSSLFEFYQAPCGFSSNVTVCQFMLTCYSSNLMLLLKWKEFGIRQRGKVEQEVSSLPVYHRINAHLGITNETGCVRYTVNLS